LDCSLLRRFRIPVFADDMEAVLADIGRMSDDPWARS
jgi:hypothetical protein